MSVYFARRVSGEGPIKIGSSYSPDSRAYEVGFTVKARLRIIALTPGSSRDEYRFHAHFERFHVGHEWFEPVPELLSMIDAINGGSFDMAVLPEHGWCVTKPYRTKASIAAEKAKAA